VIIWQFGHLLLAVDAIGIFMNREQTTIKKQMGITHHEFVRLLPQAVGSHHFHVHGNKVDVENDHGHHIHIELGEEEVRQIALMRIPTTPVTLTFVGYDEDARTAFMQRFDRAYHRGGG
jgi:hypothetical protein